MRVFATRWPLSAFRFPLPATRYPAGNGPFPAVVLGHGSGHVTRDQLRWLSSQFTKLGFAVLRFDKRGVGESTGTYTNVGVSNSPATFSILANDA